VNKVLTVLYILYFISYMLGCAYNGNVSIYSPSGDGNVIEKAVSTSAEVPIK